MFNGLRGLLLGGLAGIALISSHAPTMAQQAPSQSSSNAAREALQSRIQPNLAPSIRERALPKVRAGDSPITRAQRLRLAQSLTQARLRGIESPVVLDLRQGQLGVPRKINGWLRGTIRWASGQSLDVSNENGTRSALGLELITPTESPPRYFLVEVYHDANYRLLSAELLYVLNGVPRSEVTRIETRGEGVISFLVDAEKTADTRGPNHRFTSHSFANPFVQITTDRVLAINSVAVSPVY